MALRTYLEKLLSWIPVEIDPHDGEPNYFDFVTYYGLVSLSMGTIASLDPCAKDDSTVGKPGVADELNLSIGSATSYDAGKTKLGSSRSPDLPAGPIPLLDGEDAKISEWSKGIRWSQFADS